jgi:hypothetical protein
MDAQVRFTDGETKWFGHAARLKVRHGSLFVSGWFRTIAVIPLVQIRWARLGANRRVSQDDFTQAVVL